MKYFFKITSILFLMVSCKNHSQIKLEYNLKEGDSYKHQVIVEQNIVQNFDGVEDKTNSKLLFEYTADIKKASNNIYKSVITYSRVAVEQNAPKINYDSKNTEQEVQSEAAVFEALVNKNFEISFNKKGEITEVKGTDKLIDSIIASVTVFDESQKKMIRESFEKQYGEEALKSSLLNKMLVYPNKKLKTGSKWSFNQLLEVPYPINLAHTYQLKKHDKKHAYIDVSSVIKSKKGKMEIGGIEMTMELKGTQSGELIVDLASGLLYQSNMTQKINGTLKLFGVKVPVDVISKVTVKKM